MARKQIAWNGDKSRRLRLYRPCPCGCDKRSGDEFAGYLSASDEDGNGFSIYIETEEVFSELAKHVQVQVQ